MFKLEMLHIAVLMIQISVKTFNKVSFNLPEDMKYLERFVVAWGRVKYFPKYLFY